MSEADQLFTDFTQDYEFCERLSLAASYSSKRRSTWVGSRRRSSATTISSASSTSNNDILNDIHDLSLLEKERNDDEVDMTKYRSKVKNLLTNLMLKLEENVEYQRSLEDELFRLEQVDVQNRRLQKQLDRTNRKLEEISKEKEKIKNARKVELQVLSEYTSRLNKSIEELNNNFEIEEEDMEEEEEEEEEDELTLDDGGHICQEGETEEENNEDTTKSATEEESCIRLADVEDTEI